MKEIDLEYEMVGDGPTPLIIETGAGGSFYDWKPLANEVKESFTTVLYHRSGYGKSQAAKQPRTTRNIAEALDCLIENIGIREKFVLMGHSYGGLCAQHYARMFPDRLKGVIFIDSTSHNFQQLYNLDIPVMNSMIRIDKMVQSCLENSKKSTEELAQEFKDMLADIETKNCKYDAEKIKEFVTNPLLYSTAADEFENWGKSSEDIKNSGGFPDIPLTVIARDEEFAAKPWLEHNIPEKEAILYEEVWRDLQVELSELSPKGKLIVAENSDHQVHIDRLNIVIGALKQFL